MLLDFSQDANKLRDQVERLKVSLKSFAELHVTESRTERDQFLDDCFGLIKELHWDSVLGGCYQQQGDSIQLSAMHNILLAEFLLAAGHTFFNGELNYVGNNLLTAMTRLLYQEQTQLFADSISFTQTTAPFILDGKILLESLTQQECLLLASLLGTSGFQPDQTYWISYRRSLAEASEQADIYLKQAQTMEQNLRLKLVKLTHQQYSLASLGAANQLSLNAQIISVLVQATLWNQNSESEKIVLGLKKVLVNWLSSISPQHQAVNSYAEIIEVCYALLNYCQLNFERKILTLVYQTLSLVELKQVYSARAYDLMARSLSILTQLKPYMDEPKPFKRLDTQYQSLSQQACQQTVTVKVLCDLKTNQQTQKQWLLSSYDPGLKIYSPG